MQGYGARLEDLSPVEAARALQHLPGLVFFDTAGNLPSGCIAPVSLLAARPLRMLRGNIHRPEDLERLRQALQEGAAQELSGGLCGRVSYAGDFVFGDYPEILTYDHAAKTWGKGDNLASGLWNESDDGRAEAGAFRELSSREEFIAGVTRAQEWIAAGDIYQVNLAQAFVAEIHGGGGLFSLYEHLRQSSPAPMAAYLRLGEEEILSSSPESFLRISGRKVETRPIKGTRPRFADTKEDRRSAKELQDSPKEQAELVMITDLLRNDLGRVCEYGSVEVAEMLRLETLGQVHHLVSTVRGRLRKDADHLAALAECFPGGSITGAPKKRAMEIIAALEKIPRGVYCGALGYFRYNGESQFNIAIRTLVRTGNELRYHVGAGIVADSEPVKEYEETLHKAAGIRLALERWATSLSEA